MVYRVFREYGALLGAVLGVVLVLLGWLIDRTGVELPLLWMLLGASLILGLCFYGVGRSVSAQERELEKVAVDSGAGLREVQRYIQSLADGNYGESVSVDLDGQTAADLERFRSALVRENENKARLQWETQGLAQFSALLRGVQDLSAMSQDVVRFIVKYLNCNQGSFYRVKETDALYPVLELEACYAYDRLKHLTRTVDAGQGLLGQCYYEAQPILLYEVPQNYLSITSGLGHATPRCILIMPAVAEGKVLGVIEIAAFHRLGDHEVAFCKKAAEAFATVIHALATHEHIKQLLHQSQGQMEQLRSQEEEMRQNLEELKATEEQLSHQLGESRRMKFELETRERVLGLTTILSETDPFGTITFVNDKFCEVAKYKPEELLGKPHNIVRHPDMPQALFALFWSEIRKGNVFKGIVKNRTKDGNHYWVQATIVPVKDAHGKVVKYIGARYHLTDDVQALALYNKQAEQLGFPLLQG
jgi:PAS domain S-box-containing protein